MSYQRNKKRDGRRYCQSEIQEMKHKALCFGFGDSFPTGLMEQFTVWKTNVQVPVTTRAVGFYVQLLYKTVYAFYRHKPDRIPECSPYALYRVTLAQFEYRLLYKKNYTMMTAPMDNNLLYRQCEIIQRMKVTFSPLANLLAGIGCFEFKGTTFYPTCPKDDILGILFSNLGPTVTKMANEATPCEIRRSFYDLNPLPFAQWNQPQGAMENSDHPILLNPEDYMPVGYAIEDFQRDVHQVRNFIYFVSRKFPNMVSQEAIIDYNGPGHQRILVSNDAAGLRNPDRLYQNQWADEGLPQGDLDSFWSPEIISGQDFLMGFINLVGERRTGVGDAFVFRSPMVAKAKVPRHSWTSVVLHTSFNLFRYI